MEIKKKTQNEPETSFLPSWPPLPVAPFLCPLHRKICNFCPSYFPLIVLLTLIWLLSYHKTETALARSLAIDTFCQFIYQFRQQLLTLTLFSLLVFLLPLPALLNLFCWLFLLNLVTKCWNVLGVLPWMVVLWIFVRNKSWISWLALPHSSSMA